RSGPRHQPDHHRRGDRPAHRGRVKRASPDAKRRRCGFGRGHGHPPRKRAAGRRRSRACRRGDARQGARRPPVARLARFHNPLTSGSLGPTGEAKKGRDSMRRNKGFVGLALLTILALAITAMAGPSASASGGSAVVAKKKCKKKNHASSAKKKRCKKRKN